MPRGRPKGSKNKPKNDAYVPDEPVHFKAPKAPKAPKPAAKVEPVKGSFFNSSKWLLPEMMEERKTPVVVPPGVRRVSFSSFDVPSCHRFAKMLMTKYGYTDPSMPKPKKNGGGWYTFDITEPTKGYKNVD